MSNRVRLSSQRYNPLTYVLNLLTALGSVGTILWLWQILVALWGNPTILEPFFSEIVIPVYGSLLFGSVVFLVLVNAKRFNSWRTRRRPEYRFKELRGMLQNELRHIESDQKFRSFFPRSGGSRFAARETIRLKLASLGIDAPDCNLSDDVYERYLATIIPLANVGDIDNAMLVSLRDEWHR